MWFIFALAVSCLNAFYYIGNQNSKLKPTLYIIYRGFFTAISVIPLLLFLPPDFQWQFFAIVIVQGFAISFVDLRYFHAFQKFGAEVVCTIKPLTVLLTFALWIIIKPYMFGYYLSNPLRSTLIIASILVIVYATAKYRQQRVGLNCFTQVFPLLVISALIDSSNKSVTEYVNGNILAGAVWRVFITGIIIGFFNLFIARKHNLKLKDIIKPKNLRKGLFILFLTAAMITVNFSLYYAENPAYTSAIIYTSVIWIMGINYLQKLLGRKKTYPHIAKKWIFTLLIAAIILIIATS